MKYSNLLSTLILTLYLYTSYAAETHEPIIEIRIGINKRERNPEGTDPILLTTAAEKEKLMAEYYRKYDFIKDSSNSLLLLSKSPQVRSATLDLLTLLSKKDNQLVNIALQITFEKDELTHCYLNIVRVGLDGRRKEIKGFNIDEYQFGRIQPKCELNETLVFTLLNEAISLSEAKTPLTINPASNGSKVNSNSEDQFN